MMKSYLRRWSENRKGTTATQFPPEIIGDVTVYPRYIAPDGKHNSVKCVLKGCSWQNDNSAPIFDKTGTQIPYNVTIFVPYRGEVTGRQYIPFEEWLELPVAALDKFWSINLETTRKVLNLPLIIKGESDKEFPWGTEANVTKEENEFIAAKRIKQAKEQLFGSLELQHIVIRV